MKIWSVVVAVALSLGAVHADAAKRFGGAKSIGKQSSNVTQREAAPGAQPGAPAPAQGAAAAPNTAARAPGAPTQPVAGVQPKRPWGAMLGGLAAGLGLAWLASSLGLGEGLANVMTVLMLLAVLGLAVGWLLRRRAAPAAPALAYPAGAGGGTGFAHSKPYNPRNVGNDASARPWERNSMAFDASSVAAGSAGGSMIGSALTGTQSWGIPAGFDTEGFLKAAKTHFVTLQGAWDRSDMTTLRSMMTDEMLAEIQSQLAERERQGGSGTNQTDVVMLEAHLLGIEELPAEYMASVEFSGMIREEPSSGPSPFREVWNMTKPKAGGGWLVAGVQALQ
ncbi:MAG: Tim44 domain-containing protein [Rhodoferax sp.]